MNSIDHQVWQIHAWRNRFQSFLLLGLMAGFTALLGYLLWGWDGFIVVFFCTLIAIIFNPSIAPRLIMSMYRAVKLSPKQAPGLNQYLALLSQRAGLARQPELYYIPSQMLNAFAVGAQSHSAIGITDGLLNTLAEDELLGVLAHEISHIRSNDLRVMGVADLLSRTTSILSLFGQLLLLISLPLMLYSSVTINWLAIFLLIFAPNLSALAQLALSRTREFDADLNAARLTGNPEGLARALMKIENVQGGWFERIFLPGRRVPEPSLLRTHPPVEERIRRLMDLKVDFFPMQIQESAMSMNYPQIRVGSLDRRPRWHINGLWF